MYLFYFIFLTPHQGKSSIQRNDKMVFHVSQHCNMSRNVMSKTIIMSEIILGNSFLASVVKTGMDFSHLITRVIVQLLTEFPNIRLQCYECKMEIILFNTLELSVKYYFLCILQQILSQF